MDRILLVEDNEANREMLSRRLRRNGYEVRTATDGREAVEAVNADAPDLILMDLSMPEMDGWEATRQLKTNEQTRSIPIIALTAHALENDIARAIKAGCDQYQTKPVMFDRLIKEIESLLEASRATR